MTRNLIVQFFVSVEKYSDPTYNQIGINEELYKYSTISVEQYAKTIGCRRRVQWLIFGGGAAWDRSSSRSLTKAWDSATLSMLQKLVHTIWMVPSFAFSTHPLSGKPTLPSHQSRYLPTDSSNFSPHLAAGWDTSSEETHSSQRGRSGFLLTAGCFGFSMDPGASSCCSTKAIG